VTSVTSARRTLGAGSLWIFGVGASSPLTVLVDGVVATYASTGVVGVPASFVLLTVALALLAVGYLAMSRRVVHAAPFYALLARGMGGRVAAAGAAAIRATPVAGNGMFRTTAAAPRDPCRPRTCPKGSGSCLHEPELVSRGRFAGRSPGWQRQALPKPDERRSQ
jgi:hypothetical protein